MAAPFSSPEYDDGTRTSDNGRFLDSLLARLPASLWECRVVEIRSLTAPARRSRGLGANARRGPRAGSFHVSLVSVTTDTGEVGLGPGHIGPAVAVSSLGESVGDLLRKFAEPGDVRFDLPLWDLAGRIVGVPVFDLLAQVMGGTESTRTVPCYDTCLTLDDLGIADDSEGAGVIAAAAAVGIDAGHRAFKVKVGRGGHHMELEAGLRRDVAVLRAVREVIGPDCLLMADANDAYNYNLAWRLLLEAQETDLYWFEEPFHEHTGLFAALRDHLRNQGIETLLADGEGPYAPASVDLIRSAAVDVAQMDILEWGISGWLQLVPFLEESGVWAAPHHFGLHLGNLASAHLSAAIPRFSHVEWDDTEMEGVELGVRVRAGTVTIPTDAPGLGYRWDPTWLDDLVGERWELAAR